MDKDNDLVALPHLSWSGPAPSNDVDSYALAIALRLVGADYKVGDERAADLPPSVLTTGNMSQVARMYAFCHDRIVDDHIHSYGKLLSMMQSVSEDEIVEWIDTHDKEVHSAEAELLEYVDTKSNPGFRCYG